MSTASHTITSPPHLTASSPYSQPQQQQQQQAAIPGQYTPQPYGGMAGMQQGGYGGMAGMGGMGMGMGMGMAGGSAGVGVDSTGTQRRAHLYVGNLSPRVTEYMLTEIFAVAGQVAAAKIIPDRTLQHGGINYGFVEYADIRSAEQALQTLNGRKIFDTEIRVNWAYQNNQGSGLNPLGGVKEDTQNHFHVFVGDLSPEVNDEALGKAFGAFQTLSEARVMWDMNSGKSRGYGFLAFRDKADAEQAITTMNGEWLGSRAIRVNWANQKTQTGGGSSGGGGMGMGAGVGGMSSGIPSRPAGYGTAPAPINFQGGPLDYETVAAQTPAFNTTVYVGNLIPYSTQADLIPLFQGYGYIVEIRMQADRGFAFVKLDTHEHAAQAIVNLQNYPIHGRPIKCSWGKDKEGGAATGSVSAAGAGAGAGVGMQQAGMGMMGYNPAAMGMYGMQANAYGQYAGYPGYGSYGQPAAGQTAQAGASGTAQAAYWGQQAGNQWGAYYGGQGQTQAGQQGGQQS